MIFWDSSAIIPLFIDESYSLFLRNIHEQTDEITAWWGSEVECYSALYRKYRSGHLDEIPFKRATNILEELVKMWIEVLPEKSVREEAKILLSIYKLRAADALQLAAAKVWAGHFTGGHSFVCLDARLREAAAKEGFKIIPEKL